MTTLQDTLEALRDLLTDQLSTEEQPIHVEAGFFRSAELPAINVFPGAPAGIQGAAFAAFDDLYGGWPVNVRVVVSPADLAAGESLLWALMDDVGDLSVLAALDSDHTLGGTAQDIAWGEWSDTRDFSPPDSEGRFVGAVLPLIVAKAHS